MHGWYKINLDVAIDATTRRMGTYWYYCERFLGLDCCSEKHTHDFVSEPVVAVAIGALKAA